MLCDDPEGWDGEEDGREGMYISIRLIQFVVRQKSTQHLHPSKKHVTKCQLCIISREKKKGKIRRFLSRESEDHILRNSMAFGDR